MRRCGAAFADVATISSCRAHLDYEAHPRCPSEPRLIRHALYARFRGERNSRMKRKSLRCSLLLSSPPSRFSRFLRHFFSFISSIVLSAIFSLARPFLQPPDVCRQVSGEPSSCDAQAR